MKRKLLLITTVIFFLLVNLTYYWEADLGPFAIPSFLVLLLVYFILAIIFFVQLYFAFKENFKNSQRLFTVSILIIVLCLVAIKPNGIINFSRFESKDLLIAQREGAANCMTTFLLKKNNTFIERNVCFGTSETKGNYEVRGDTVFFTNVKPGRGESNYYKFAVIKPASSKAEKIMGDFVRYKDYDDSLGQALWITKNDLEK